jgi:catechol 2,3-dioxygenase-like lactoylglutathione lyase family enzyme
MGRPGLRMELVILRAGLTKLELIAYYEPARTPYVPADGNPGAAHISVLVDDVRAWHAALTADGVRAQSPPVRITEGPNIGGWAVFLLDPDGVWVELLEVTSERRAVLDSDAPR